MNPYQVLGVSRDADDAAIKQAYRRLAQASHPDHNPDDPTAEERFKEVGSAYAVLSDPEKRKAYDQFGDAALHPNFDPRQAHGFGGGPFGGGGVDLGSLFEDLLGGAGGQSFGRQRRGPQRGADLETTLELDFAQAALGCTRRVTVHGKSLDVRIPAGVADGAKIRLAGKGAPGSQGGPSGHLFANIRVRPHRLFRREGRDLHLEASITVSEAILGTEFEVPTLDGKLVLQVAPGTDSGSKLRVRGKGIPGQPPGDLYVAIRIRVPKEIDDETRQKVKELGALGPHGLREDLSS